MTTSHPPFRPRSRALAAACVAAALLSLAACGGSEPDSPPTTAASGPAEYVALGDSFTAVSGTGPFEDDACFRSAEGYPGLVAEKLGITSFDNVSCGGATSENLTSTQYPTNGQNPPQLQAVTKKATLVTLGMGLNDEKLSSTLLVPCYLVDAKNATCKAYLELPDSQFNEAVAKVGADVANDLKEIKAAAAPGARIILVGYPRVLADKGTCSSQLPLPQKAADRYRTVGAKVNETLKSVAQKAGADFIDMYAASKGHDLCSKDPWVNGQNKIEGEAEAFHPFPEYHQAVADKIAALLGK